MENSEYITSLRDQNIPLSLLNEIQGAAQDDSVVKCSNCEFLLVDLVPGIKNVCMFNPPCSQVILMPESALSQKLALKIVVSRPSIQNPDVEYCAYFELKTSLRSSAEDFEGAQYGR